MTQQTWTEMDRDERVRYLTPLIGKEVRFITSVNFKRWQQVFGETAPLSWEQGTLQGLLIVSGLPSSWLRPGVEIKRNKMLKGGFDGLLDRSFLGPTIPGDIYAFVDLYQIEGKPQVDESDTADSPECLHEGEIIRLRQLRDDIVAFCQHREEMPQYLDICAILRMLIDKSYET